MTIGEIDSRPIIHLHLAGLQITRKPQNLAQLDHYKEVSRKNVQYTTSFTLPAGKYHLKFVARMPYPANKITRRAALPLD